MQANDIYEEKILSKESTGLFGTVAAVLFFAFVYQIFIGPIGTRPAPNWVFLVMSLLFLGIAINFSRLRIRIAPESMIVGYGILKYAIRRENIEDCYLDKASATRYRGWGIRLGRVGGEWKLVYNIIRGPQLVLLLKKGRFKKLVFSTKNPEKVMMLIKRGIGQHSLSES